MDEDKESQDSQDKIIDFVEDYFVKDNDDDKSIYASNLDKKT